MRTYIVSLYASWNDLLYINYSIILWFLSTFGSSNQQSGPIFASVPLLCLYLTIPCLAYYYYSYVKCCWYIIHCNSESRLILDYHKHESQSLTGTYICAWRIWNEMHRDREWKFPHHITPISIALCLVLYCFAHIFAWVPNTCSLPSLSATA